MEAIQPDSSIAEERDALLAQVEELRGRCAQLEEQLAAQETAPAQEAAVVSAGVAEELEAYRRAERTERMARERSELIYHQVNGVLAEATAKVDGVASEISTMADQVMQQLNQLQTAVSGSKQALQDAVSTMYAIKPNN